MGDGAASTAVDAYYAATTGIQNLARINFEGLDFAMDAILRPFIMPLMYIVEKCIGDPDELIAEAQVWEATYPQLDRAAYSIEEERQALANQWSGDVSNAAQQRINEYIALLRQLASEMRAVAKMLREAAEFLGKVETELRIIVRELVQYLILSWIVAQLLAPETWGGSEVVFLAFSAPTAGATAATRAAIYALRLRAFLVVFLTKLQQWKKTGNLLQGLAAWLVKKQVTSVVSGLTGLPTKFGALNEILGNPGDKISDARMNLVQKAAEVLDPILEPLESVTDPLRPYVKKAKDEADSWNYQAGPK